MEIYLGNDLGNFVEKDCQSIKKLMDGKSYYKFEVSWSNFAGNCQLIVKTDYPNASEEDVKRMFLHVLTSEVAGTIDINTMLEVYVKEKYRNKKSVSAFNQEHGCSFIFDDAELVAGMLSSPVRQNEQGYPFVYVPNNDSLDYVLRKLQEDGYDVFVFNLK